MDDKRVRPDIQQESGTEGPASSSQRRPHLRGQRIAATALALVSVLLIGISAASFATGAVSPEGLFRTTVEELQEAGSAAASAKAEEAAKDDSASAKKDAKDAEDDSAASSEAKAAEADSDADAGGQEASRRGGSSRSTTSSSDAASTSSSSGASDAQGSQAKPSEPQRDPDTVTVRVIVDSSRAGNAVSADQTLTFEKGATAYDAVCALGLSVNARNTGFGIYVAGIGGLAEFDHGGESGWKYSVNGTFPNYSAGKAVLSDGDVVRWVYVTAVDQG